MKKRTSYRKEGSLSFIIEKQLGYTLKKYCELRGLSYTSLTRGFVSEHAASILHEDGIEVEVTTSASRVKLKTQKEELEELRKLKKQVEKVFSPKVQEEIKATNVE